MAWGQGLFQPEGSDHSHPRADETQQRLEGPHVFLPISAAAEVGVTPKLHPRPHCQDGDWQGSEHKYIWEFAPSQIENVQEKKKVTLLLM